MGPRLDDFYRECLTTGCGTGSLIYCPGTRLTRAEMAPFIDRAFHLYPCNGIRVERGGRRERPAAAFSWQDHPSADGALRASFPSVGRMRMEGFML